MKLRLVPAATKKVHSRVNESITVVGKGMEDSSTFTETQAAVRGAEGRYSVKRVALPNDGNSDPAPLKGWGELEIGVDS